MVDVSLPIHVLRMHLDDPAADAPGLRVPAHVIARLEPFRHASTCFAASMALEVPHGTLVLFGRAARLEGAEIAAPAGLRVHLARIEAIAARLELADHRRLPRAARLCAALAIANLLRSMVWFLSTASRGRKFRAPRQSRPPVITSAMREGRRQIPRAAG